jgi:hypothetical protein
MVGLTTKAGRPFLARLLVVVLICGGAAVWGAGDERSKVSNESASVQRVTDVVRQPMPIIGRVEPRQAARFSLLRSRPESITGSLQRRLGRPSLGINWNLAQKLHVPAGGRFWAVPGRNHLCILAELESGAAGTSCTTTESALKHGASIVLIGGPAQSWLPGSRRFIVGIAPDGKREALAHTDGSVAAAPVKRSVFWLRDVNRNPPQQLTLR